MSKRPAVIDPRTPCIVGIAQRTVRKEDGPAPEPLALWAEVARAAAAESGARKNPIDELDSIRITYCQSWQYDDPVDRLAERLGVSPSHRQYSGIGGTTAQLLVQEAAERILDGRSELALVCGAEALSTVKAYARRGEAPPWSFRRPGKHVTPFEAEFDPGETAVGLNHGAAAGFALWDSARRARRGTGLAAYRDQLGAVMSGLSQVAAKNPHAWFREFREPGFLANAGPGNRMVAYPYTKYTCAIIEVDMAAAVLVASEATADRLGIPREKRVYPRGWAYAQDPVYIAERDDLSSSTAMRVAGAEALRCAGIGMPEIGHLDLYSCFPSSVNFARDALGIADEDSRALTVTGGLPYFGGPASNYTLHSVVQMAESLRADPDAFGLVSGVGMSMSKHGFGVYSAGPPASAPAKPDRTAMAEAVGSAPRREIVRDFTGAGKVAAYTVLHDRSGDPVTGIAVCEVAGGARTYASFDDTALLRQVEAEEFVGTSVFLTGTGPSSRLTVEALTSGGRNGAVP